MEFEALDRYHRNHQPGKLVSRRIAEIALQDEAHLAEEKPYFILNRGFQHINDAVWMAEHQIRGNHSLLDHELPKKMLAEGLNKVEWYLGLNRNIADQNASNIIMARPVYNWLSDADRDTGKEKYNSVMDDYLNNIAGSLACRYDLYLSEERKIMENKIPSYEYKSLIGPLLEAMVTGLVTEDQQFRDAKIIALPAPPILEKTSPINNQPSDILLWQIQGNTITPIGGIQCKARVKSRGHIPANNFTVEYKSQPARGSALIAEGEIKKWLNQENLEAMHDKLMLFVANSSNYSLQAKLDLNLSKSQLIRASQSNYTV